MFPFSVRALQSRSDTQLHKWKRVRVSAKVLLSAIPTSLNKTSLWIQWNSHRSLACLLNAVAHFSFHFVMMGVD